VKMSKAVRHTEKGNDHAQATLIWMSINQIAVMVEPPSCDRDDPIGWITKGRNLF